MRARPPSILLLGPALTAVSGVSTHLNQLFQSGLAKEFRLLHFQVGSEGRRETKVGKLLRFTFSPVQFLWRLLLERPSVIHLNTSMERKSYWRDMVYLIIARCLARKVVYQVHGGALPQAFFKNSPLLTALLKRVLHSADTVVVLAQEELLAYRAFAPGLPLELVPNAIDPGPDPAWKHDMTGQPLALQIAYVGRIDENKGVFEIIEGLAMLVSTGRQVRLVIAGSGPDETRLRSLVIERGLENAVEFRGVVRAAEKQEIWQQSDIFVFPTYREGLPYALLESMAARTTPVVTAVGAIPDVIDDGVHGVFISPHDPHGLAQAICRLDDDRALLRRMGEAARKRIESHYTTERLATDFRCIYLRLTSGVATY
ncbi:MAG: glycosyl transferase group 1 family protein [Herminiimonas sp.]|nr:glycosyl transferase group 1 family protein [Herminiimonas sp.]MDB5852733.1 glycosyl transferase group 1 family protein [Herminiimonas sp.]